MKKSKRLQLPHHLVFLNTLSCPLAYVKLPKTSNVSWTRSSKFWISVLLTLTISLSLAVPPNSTTNTSAPFSHSYNPTVACCSLPNVSSLFLRFHSRDPKFNPWVPNLFRNVLPIYNPVPLPIPLVKTDTSWECSISSDVSFHTQLPFKLLFTTSFPALKSKAPIRLPGTTHSLQPSTSAKQAYHPHPTPPTRPGHGRFIHRHGYRPPTAGAGRLSNPRLLLQEAEPGTAKVQ